MRKTRLFYFAVIVFCLQGCATVDLRSAGLKTKSLNQIGASRGRQILRQAIETLDPADQWSGFDRLRIITRDVWKANVVRRLTPITQADQRVEFTFQLDKSDAQMKYLNGKKTNAVIGIDRQQTYTVVSGLKKIKPDNKTKIYLAPVRDYFFWPLDLMSSEIVLFDGEEFLGGKRYFKIFVTDGPFEPAPKADQYIVWIDQETMQIKYVEFTLRELLKSYKGVVQYGDYRSVQGITAAHQIKLKDKIKSEKYSHEFIVESMDFD